MCCKALKYLNYTTKKIKLSTIHFRVVRILWDILKIMSQDKEKLLKKNA
jgi:hypothetical protein